MNYQNVAVIAPSNDKGVDIVADIELGITSVREVVQAKRQKSNVQRTVLDALRGSLYRFQAVRGTIITTAGFSKGAMQAAFEAGAPPITLIDGSKLIDCYYQLLAIDKTIEASAKGQNRILLVMATGTGKTFTAFQIIWRLWKSKAKKRILFLADRNILVDRKWAENGYFPLFHPLSISTNS
jgi:predicted helicase